MRHLCAAAAALALASSASAQSRDAPVTPRQLMRHIEVLASDRFEGRAPATEGERLTIAYIASELARRGVAPGAADGSWFQSVGLVERRPDTHSARWSAGGRDVAFDAEHIVLVGRDSVSRIEAAPVVFVGHGFIDRERGIDQLAGADLAGAVALVLVEPPVEGFPPFQERVRTLVEAGAAAVLGIVADELPWDELVSAARFGETSLDSRPMPAISGTMPAGEMARLVAAAGGDFAALLNDQPGPAFRAVPLALRATLEARSHVRRFTSHNVVGRIAGTGGGSGESVLLLGHWDHLGLCRPEGEEDRICNGAVDNASGIATLIEAAGRLARRRPRRDVILLATTAEEIGLFGAEQFAADPPVPLGSIVAAINIDTVAIHGRGQPVAVIGRGIEPLDEAIVATAAAIRRPMDTTFAADAFLRRQDGWALAQAGVPAVMVGGSFADMASLQAFLGGSYHGPDDEARASLPLDGAAEDADLVVALARRLADPSLYSRPR